MKQKIIIAALILLIGAAAIFYDRTSSMPGTPLVPPAPVLTDIPLPDATFHDFDGNSFTLSEFHGRIVLVNFWASWCPPCIKEIPELLRIAESRGDGLVLLAVTVDEDLEKAKDLLELIKNRNPELTVPENTYWAWDADKHIAQEIFYTTRFPESYILGENGRIKAKIIGDDIEKIENIIDYLMMQKSRNTPAESR